MPTRESLRAFLPIALLVAFAAPAVAQEGPDVPDRLLRDDVRGTVDGPLRVGFFATEGSRLSATLRADVLLDDPALGLGLLLEDPDGTDVPVAGTRQDRSVEARDLVRWSGIRLEKTGTYVLIVSAETAGGFQLTLAGALRATRVVADAEEALAPAGEAAVAFTGIAGGSMTASLRRLGAHGFVGAVVSVAPEDGDPVALPDRGAVPLTAGGDHVLVLRNDGQAAGLYRAVVKVRPPRARRRTVVLTEGGAILVPQVRRVAPRKAVRDDDAVDLVVTGFDFREAGLDVRLVRGGRTDILGTDVEVVSSTEIRCRVDLDTLERDGVASTGTWKVGVWNAPEYDDEEDRTTLVRGSPTRSIGGRFRSVPAGSVTLPRGVKKGSEVWFLLFDDDFQDDLDRMGLGSTDGATREAARDVVEAYTVLYLRHLFGNNETTGTLAHGSGVPVSFVVKEPGHLAGDPGVDYNRIEIGGGWMAGDPVEQGDLLTWGFAAEDAGNAQRDDLVVEKDEVRLGLGARTRALDPSSGSAAAGWVLAMAPLRGKPLTVLDRNYFRPGFLPANRAQADRYRDITGQIERASREIAAVIAHHIGKAMGLPTGGTGPMQNPATAGSMWSTVPSLSYSSADTATLRANAVPHALPGKGGKLNVTYFPLLDMENYLLADCVTDTPYVASFRYAGGRPDAIPSQYRVQWVAGSNVPAGLTISFDGIAGRAPVFAAQNQLYCTPAKFITAVTDLKRGGTSFFRHRINVIPDPAHPQIAGNANLVLQAQNCITQVRNAP